MKFKNKFFYSALVLTIIGVLSALILASVNIFTKVDEAERFNAKIAEFYPSAQVQEAVGLSGYKNDQYTEILAVARMTDGALAVRAKSKKAYSADGLELLVFLKDGVILKVEKYAASETPGIGSKVVSSEYLAKYSGKAALEFAEKESAGDKVVDAITGATKTSSGVNYAVTAAAKFYLWEAER